LPLTSRPAPAWLAEGSGWVKEFIDSIVTVVQPQNSTGTRPTRSAARCPGHSRCGLGCSTGRLPRRPMLLSDSPPPTCQVFFWFWRSTRCAEGELETESVH